MAQQQSKDTSSSSDSEEDISKDHSETQANPETFEGVVGVSESEEDMSEDHSETQANPETLEGVVGDELCIVCGFGEEDDDEGDKWVECDQCSNWVHIRCLPDYYSYKEGDEEYVCPVCLRRKKPRSMRK